MLVEDDKSLREIYGVRLLAEGYEIISAGDGEEALAMAVKEKPDLILSDVMMPKISGFDMLDILRSTPETKSIKVIMMTALSSEDQRTRGESLGANRYLVKSQVGIEDVVRTVHDVLADTPTAANPTGQIFSTPAPTAATPSKPITVTDAPANEQTAPILPPIVPTVPRPDITPSESDEKTPQPIAPPTQLPQPNAPFTVATPSSEGDRVVEPLTPPEPIVDMNKLIEQELHDGSDTNPQE